MVENLISRHLVALFMILIFSIVLHFRKSFRNLEARYFWLTIISCFFFFFEDLLETMTAEIPALRIWSILFSVIGYTYRSTAVLGLLLVIIPKEKRSFVLWIPSLITLIICSTAFFTDIAFGFDKDYHFYRGPLGLVPFVVPVFYLILILWVFLKHYTRRNSSGRYIILICGVFCLAATGVDVVYGGVRLNEAIIFSSVCLFLTLFSHDNRLDPLTGLLNRKAFYDDFKAEGRSVRAVVSLDMNGLKRLNDSQGHKAGDEALMAIGKCISEVTNHDTLAYRIGGDEFLILFFHDHEEKVCQVEEQIKESVSREGYSISSGHAMRDSGGNPEDVIRVSDSRMYEDKANYYRQNDRDRRRSFRENTSGMN